MNDSNSIHIPMCKYIGPTLKLKRHFIAEKYSELITALYDDQDDDDLNEAHI